MSGKAMAPELQVRCLGRLSLHVREAPDLAPSELPLPATLKAQSLLAYLILHRRQPQSRDHLAEMFWGDRPEYNARRSLATALWQIRRCLPGDDFILADVAKAQFKPDSLFWLDVTEFETLVQTRNPSVSALKQAVELYQGDFLDGFYDDWVLTERYRLESLCHDVLSQLMAMEAERGEHGDVLVAALRLLEQDPLAEDAHRAAMRAYCHLGQRHAALAQYERCQAALQSELGVAPMAETQALRQAIVEDRLGCAPASLIAPATLIAPPRREWARNPLDAAGQIPLVGREQELAFLADGWQAALRGDCQLLLISGGAGVGKTRLVQAFADQLRWRGHQVLQGRCYEFERLLPYQPVAEALRSLPAAVAAAAITTLPEWVVAQVARLAPEFLGRDDRLPEAVSSQQAGLQERLFEAVSRFLHQLASQSPLLLILDDLHWATDSTLQLLHYLARAVTAHPLLIVGALRSEAASPDHPLATLGRRLERDGLARRLGLAPLPATAVTALIGQLAGVGEVAAPLAERLYQETEGNPFYLIETIKALFEQGAIRVEGGVWRADFTALSRGRLPLPASVSEMIAARVGRLSEAAQDAVRVAAVAGREFDFDLLQVAWGKGEEATLAALDDLLRQRLIGEAVGGADYAFTHHKIQEVVYESLPHRRRLYMHRQMGLAMERWLGAEAGARAGELAFHFEQAQQLDAGVTDKALAYLLQAGQKAERQSANQEALAYYQRGLDILRSQPETPQRLRQELELQMALTVPTTVVHGYASSETRHVYDRNCDLARRLGDIPALFTALAGQSRAYGVSGDIERAAKAGEEMLVIAESTRETTQLLEVYRILGSTAFAWGRLREARAFWERGAALYSPTEHERHGYRFGHDPAAVFHGYLIPTLWLLGYPDQALAQGQRLCDLLQSWSHPTSLAYARCFLALGACLRQDAQGVRSDAEEAMRLGQAYGLPSWIAMAMALRGWALVEQGQVADGLAQLQQGITAWRARGFKHLTPIFLTLHAESFLKARMLDEATVALTAACTIVQAGMDAYWMGEVDRLHGELVRVQGGEGGLAEAHFCKALATARQQEARMLELRAAVSLARLWQSQGKVQPARQLLTEVYGWFSEGFDIPDLQTAKTLLMALS